MTRLTLSEAAAADLWSIPKRPSFGTGRGRRNRGSLTVWISLTAGKLVNWDAPRPRKRKPDRQRKYSNHAIETAVTLGMVFHLSSRQSEGLLRSLFALMKLDNDVPDHTTISRRKAKLGKVSSVCSRERLRGLLRFYHREAA